jgi:hypothetical protein
MYFFVLFSTRRRCIRCRKNILTVKEFAGTLAFTKALCSNRLPLRFRSHLRLSSFEMSATAVKCNAGQLLGLALEGLIIRSSQLAANKFHAPINRISPARWGHFFSGWGSSTAWKMSDHPRAIALGRKMKGVLVGELFVDTGLRSGRLIDPHMLHARVSAASRPQFSPKESCLMSLMSAAPPEPHSIRLCWEIDGAPSHPRFLPS